MRHYSHAVNKEWGRKARKEWDRLSGINNADRRMAITEGRNDMNVITCPYCGVVEDDVIGYCAACFDSSGDPNEATNEQED